MQCNQNHLRRFVYNLYCPYHVMSASVRRHIITVTPLFTYCKKIFTEDEVLHSHMCQSKKQTLWTQKLSSILDEESNWTNRKPPFFKELNWSRTHTQNNEKSSNWTEPSQLSNLNWIWTWCLRRLSRHSAEMVIVVLEDLVHSRVSARKILHEMSYDSGMTKNCQFLEIADTVKTAAVISFCHQHMQLNINDTLLISELQNSNQTEPNNS